MIQYKNSLRRYARRLRVAVALHMAWLLSPRLALRFAGVSPIAGAAKQTGLGWTVAVADSAGTSRDISNDITDVQFGTPSGVQDITGIDKSAMERLLLLADGTITLKGVFNVAVNKSHAVFKNYRTVPAAGYRAVILTPPGGSALTLNMLFTDYSHARSQNGDHIWTAPGVLADGSVPTWS